LPRTVSLEFTSAYYLSVLDALEYELYKMVNCSYALHLGNRKIQGVCRAPSRAMVNAAIVTVSTRSCNNLDKS